jgi:glucosylceramidase
VLNPAETRQEMLGFGAAFTDASCYMLNQLSPDKRAALMHELFAPDQIALNVCRTCIGASDYSKSLYSFDDGEQDDPELKKFSIDHDKAYILPLLGEARMLNPDLFLFSSPWSPPAWMKFNRSMLGGTIRKTNLEPYSRYFQKFLDAYKAEGVDINAVTVQNEVDTTVDGRYAACQWSQEDEILFVGKYLGPLFRQAGISTKIWVLDHNFTLWGRAIAELSDPRPTSLSTALPGMDMRVSPRRCRRCTTRFPLRARTLPKAGLSVSHMRRELPFPTR